jgi:spore germination protein KC
MEGLKGLIYQASITDEKGWTKMKIKLVLILIFFLSTVLTSCWGKRELSEYGMVVAIGLDKDPISGQVILTSQVARPTSLRKEAAAKEAPIQLNTSSGSTVFEAIRNAMKKYDRQQFYSHCKVIVIDEKFARDGIMASLDVITRQYEFRDSVRLIISKNSFAKDILGFKRGNESLQGMYLYKIINQQVFNPGFTNIDLLDFIKKESGEGINPVIGVMGVQKEITLPVEEAKAAQENSIAAEGAAVFKKDKLVGFLDSKETQALNWILGKVKSGVINVQSPGDKSKLVALEIKKANSKIIPQIIDKKISFNIQINLESSIAEDEGTSDVSKLEVNAKMEEEQNNYIKNEINNVIKKVQGDYASDIFGFGVSFSKKYPKEWKRLKKDWDATFTHVNYTIKVNSSIGRIGVVKKPISAPSE